MKKVIEGRYYNTNGFAIAVVAVITEGIDWSAYIGATPSTFKEHETIESVAKYGAKLIEEDARFYFPDIELPYRR
jgi:hypothetical protein